MHNYIDDDDDDWADTSVTICYFDLVLNQSME